jgi:hypothetical protein
MPLYFNIIGWRLNSLLPKHHSVPRGPSVLFCLSLGAPLRWKGARPWSRPGRGFGLSPPSSLSLSQLPPLSRSLRLRLSPGPAAVETLLSPGSKTASIRQTLQSSEGDRLLRRVNLDRDENPSLHATRCRSNKKRV